VSVCPRSVALIRPRAIARLSARSCAACRSSRAVSAVNAPFSRRRSCLRPSTFASESTSSVCARLTANASPSFAATLRDWRSVSAADFASRNAASECVASSCAPALIEFATPGSAATSPVSMLACCDAETPASS
jgi:hypothetical protein